MALIILSGPAVTDAIGSIVSIMNAPQGGGLDWNYQMIGGWYQGARSYTNKQIIITNSPFVGPVQIQQSIIGIGAVQGSTYRYPLPEYSLVGGITQIGPTEIDTGSFLHSLSIKPDAEDTRQWTASYQYGPFDIQHELGTSNAQNGSVNPLDAAPDVKWSATEYEVSYGQDVNGNPFVNAANDVLENPPKRVEARQTLEFTRNEAVFVESWAQAYREVTNSDQFLGFDVNQAKCKIITGDRIYTADYGYYWRVTYPFEFRVITITNPDGTTTVYGWEDIVLNAGFCYYNVITGKKQPMIIGGNKVASPEILNPDGTWNPSTSGSPSKPNYLTFQNYIQQPFAFLNIPASVLTSNQ